MDHNNVVPILHGIPSDGADFRPSSDSLVGRCAEVKAMTPEYVTAVLTTYAALRIPKPDINLFANWLTRDPTTWFVDVGGLGFVFFVGIDGGGDALFYFLFWDQKLNKERRGVLMHLLSEAFERFDLRRITAKVPASVMPQRDCLRKCGFMQEGIIRQAFLVDGKPEDLVVFGMLRDEHVPTLKLEL